MLYMPFLLGTQTNQIPKYVGTRLANCYSIIVPTQVLVDMYQCTDGQRIDQSPKYDPKKPYENRDPRLGYSILYPGQWHSGYKFEVHPDSTKTSAVINGETVRINNTEVTNAYGSFTGYIEKKYYDESDVPGKITQCELNFMLMRYAEVLLTYAEARIELSRIDQSVIDAINAVRPRKDVPPRSRCHGTNCANWYATSGQSNWPWKVSACWISVAGRSSNTYCRATCLASEPKPTGIRPSSPPSATTANPNTPTNRSSRSSDSPPLTAISNTAGPFPRPRSTAIPC